jgi:type II secretory pathway pseudopilin PulG
MTLFEIIIALAIAAALLVMVARVVTNMTGAGAKSEVMHLAGAIRYAYGRAAINGWRYDIVVNIDNNSYRIACSEEHSTVEREPYAEESGVELAFGDDEDDEPLFGETQQQEKALDSCSDAIVKDRSLSHNVEIVRVQTARTPEAVESGEIRIVIFPNGMIERSIIWLQAGENEFFTLFVDEMTGRVKLRTGDQEPPERFFEIEED